MRSNFAKCSECTKSDPNKRWVCVTPQEQSWTSGINFTLNWMFLPVLTGGLHPLHPFHTVFLIWQLSAVCIPPMDNSMEYLYFVFKSWHCGTESPPHPSLRQTSQHPCHGQRCPGLWLVSESPSWPLIGWQEPHEARQRHNTWEHDQTQTLPCLSGEGWCVMNVGHSVTSFTLASSSSETVYKRYCEL